MSNWIKFSDRMPTEADADAAGYVSVRWDLSRPHSIPDSYKFSYLMELQGANPDRFWNYEWLENVPEIPKPRTLEDVVNGLLAIDAQLEVLERKDLGMLGEVNSWNPD